jgi:cell division protein FtsZ
MPINLSVPEVESHLKPRITVIGVGGAGGNAVNNMIESELEGVEFVVANTDAQAMAQARTDRRIQLGVSVTHGLGAGARPEIGQMAAEESIEDIVDHIQGSNMVFITAGMGGGTGTGAAPVIARAAREQGILTVGVVTKPFHFEGTHRMKLAEGGIEELTQYVDTLIIIPNQNLFRIANDKTTFTEAFFMADEVLQSGVRGVTDLMVRPGLINLDFADIRTVMSEMGKAMMGTGEAEGEARARECAEKALCNPLLDDTSMKGARGVLINITGGPDLTLLEVDEAANRIREEVDPDARITFGATFDPSMEGKMRLSVVATGIDSEVAERPRPVFINTLAQMPKKPALVTEETGAEEDLVTEEPLLAAIENSMRSDAVEAEMLSETEEEENTVEDFAAHAAPEPAREVASAPAPAQQAPADRPFIPRAPASARTPAPARPDPMAEADMMNGGGDAPAARKAGPSLFSKVTGQSWMRRGPEAAEQPAESMQQKPQEAPRPKLSGMSPADRPNKASADDDLLEIPAFLRRQAN